MAGFFKNKIIQAVLVFLAIIGAYAMYQTFGYYLNAPEGEFSETAEDSETMTDTEESDGMGAMEGSGSTQYTPGMDLKGIHIMGNGDVMLGDGTVITDATIRADGMIEFPDGSTTEPLMDMR